MTTSRPNFLLYWPMTSATLTSLATAGVISPHPTSTALPPRAALHPGLRQLCSMHRLARRVDDRAPPVPARGGIGRAAHDSHAAKARSTTGSPHLALHPEVDRV